MESFESILWTIRYDECGDFEITTNAIHEILNHISVDYYLFCDKFYDEDTGLANLMVIESFEIKSDPNEGNQIKITGRDLKSLADRRIIWGQTVFPINTHVSSIVHDLVMGNIISPPDWEKTYQDSHSGNIRVYIDGARRAIPGFTYISQVTRDFDLSEERQYNSESLYDVITSLCKEFGFGWDILYNFNTNQFVFVLRSSINKTYDQYENTPILFSAELGNIKESNYIESSTTEKNSGLIKGEGDDLNNMYNIIGNEYTGLLRKEMGISGSDISRKTDDGTEHGNAAYLNMLYEKAKEELSKNKYTQAYEATAQTELGYNYKEDYDIGDICEIINEWGITSKVLVSEVILSVTSSNISIVPTFVSTDKEGGEQ